MNEERSFERFVADNVAGTAQGIPLPDDFYDDMHSIATTTRQRPEWLALIKEPPMRTNSHVAVGSPTVRVAAILAATLLLALALAAAGFAGQQLLAASGPIVVAQDGSGDFTTISEAVAAAEDGDEIVVRAGTYAGSITIDKDVHLHGEDRDGVVIEFGQDCTSVEDMFAMPTTCPEGTPMWDGPATFPTPFGIVLDGTAAEISDLTFAPVVNAVGVAARGGSPRIHHITMRSGPSFGSVVVHDGSEAVISESDLGGAWVFIEEQSPATIEHSSFWAVVANSDNAFPNGGPSTITDNHAHGIMFGGPATILRNTVTAPDGVAAEDSLYGQGIDVQFDTGWTIAENTVSGFSDATAIHVAARSAGTISDNTLDGNRVGVFLGLGGSEVSGNTIRGGETGIQLVAGEAVIADNVIEDNTGRGISIGGASTPSLSGNRSCGNGEDLWVDDLAEPVIDEGNEICDA